MDIGLLTADILGMLVGLAIRTFLFPFLLETLLVFCRVKQKVAMILSYILYAALAWPFMLFVTYGPVAGLGQIMFDIPFLALWITVRVLRSKNHSEKKIRIKD